jgi:hypothetical protein
MHHPTSRRTRRCSFEVPAAIAAWLALAPLGAADSWDLIVSTTSDPTVTLPGAPALDDADLIRVAGQALPAPWIVSDNWQALVHHLPTDVDAVAWRPGAPAQTAQSLAFSVLSDFSGYLDGDVLGIAPDGGVEVLVAEEQLASALGAGQAPLDLDAIAFTPDGGLLFSLQSDLEQTVLGPVANGDVLRLAPGGWITREASESEVADAMSSALGAPASVGDVHGLDFVDGELWVCVQSPGTHDGGVLALGPAARMIAEEVELGLGGAELDGLAVVPGGVAPALTLWVDDSGPGAPAAVLRGGHPGGLAMVLATGGCGALPATALPGFGAWVLDPSDPILAVQLEKGPSLVLLDGEGSASMALPLPAAGAGVDPSGLVGWTFQALDLTTATLSTPMRIALP